MSAKVPIYLKRGSRKGKKEKLRDILSSDMISPPLGDFRHTIHIGSGGESDMFGDISFLQGKFHLLPRTESSFDSDRDGPDTAPFEFSRTATVSGREQAASPLLKNAISLPVIGGPQALTLPAGKADAATPFLSHAGSLLSLHVDLGPSILEDVLQVMEKHQAERAGGSMRDPSRQEILT
ncbi:PREDICTED: cdc42 effector protein 2-like [Tauraco erythrolophus]|uniref:cdc42 effector protein 2-like n=1 Tax=Tauraco erythrolophus TaxID=121530 RepID=UPI000523D1D9|nr:PREDICTED: cdc42 effector protein 2-like [Tauraco erythrolophus]